MLGFGDQSAYRFLQIGPFHGPQLGAGASHHPFGRRAAGGDRRRAAAGFVANLSDAVCLESHRQPHDVAASRVAHFNDDGRWSEFTHMTGILKMIEESFGVHSVLQLILCCGSRWRSEG